MTLPQKLEAIRQACIAANESILDLKMGCRVKRFEGCPYDKIISIRTFSGEKLHECNLIRNENIEYHFDASTKEIESWEIIGRDILLSDVLGAMNGSAGQAFRDKWKKDLLTFFIDDTGHFGVHWVEPNEDMDFSFLGDRSERWNILRPSLDNQEEPTVNLIYEILCAK